MPDIDIVKEEGSNGHGRYVARIAGLEGEAELTFTHRSPNLVSADHTGAPESLRGTGIAAALVARLVEDARQSGFRILPLCPYVRAQYRRHPEWRDVMTLPLGEDPPPQGAA